jgi:hypothetical protein
MSVHHIREGDTAPNWRTRLFDAEGDPIDLTGAIVRLHVTEERTTTQVQIDALATPDPDQVANRGWVDYEFTSGDTNQPGRFWAEWEITFPDGSVQTVPTRGHDILIVYGQLVA